MEKVMQAKSDPFEKLLHDADLRKKTILQLKSIQEANLGSARMYLRRASIIGSIFGLLIFLRIFDVTVEQILHIPFKINQAMMIISGSVTLSFVLSGFNSSYQSELLTTQIKMLQLADYVDARNNGDSGNT